MDRWSADEAVVGVKPIADEGVVTHLRVKLSESDMEVGAEEWNMRQVEESRKSGSFEFSLRSFL